MESSRCRLAKFPTVPPPQHPSCREGVERTSKANTENQSLASHPLPTPLLVQQPNWAALAAAKSLAEVVLTLDEAAKLSDSACGVESAALAAMAH